MSVVDVRDVTISYGRNIAVDKVTFKVEQGSVYALLGRNGAGKSSLVRCIVGQQKPAGGSVALFERDAWKHRTPLMERTGVVAEDADAPPEMTAGQIERFCSRVYARWDSAAVYERLKRFGIDPKSKFGTLSKGQRKQVSLAMALASSPELVILDDPTLGLDVVARRSLFEEVVGELADRGLTVLVTTHDLAGVETIADRIGILSEGRLVLDEDLEALKSRFRRVRMTGPASIEAAKVRAWGGGTEAIVTNYDAFLQERLHGTNVVEVTAMSLEEIFIAVGGEEKGTAS